MADKPDSYPVIDYQVQQIAQRALRYLAANLDEFNEACAEEPLNSKEVAAALMYLNKCAKRPRRSQPLPSENLYRCKVYRRTAGRFHPEDRLISTFTFACKDEREALRRAGEELQGNVLWSQPPKGVSYRFEVVKVVPHQAHVIVKLALVFHLLGEDAEDAENALRQMRTEDVLSLPYEIKHCKHSGTVSASGFEEDWDEEYEDVEDEDVEDEDVEDEEDHDPSQWYPPRKANPQGKLRKK